MANSMPHCQRAGRVPPHLPVTLLEHHLRRHHDGYVAHQIYLDPHPGYSDFSSRRRKRTALW
jgi:uncharacterized protein YbgA (DUF1722 family)